MVTVEFCRMSSVCVRKPKTWACQRSARWDRYLLIRSYHTGFKNYPELMLFDVEADPHEAEDLAAARPDLVAQGLARIDEWQTDELRRSHTATDPLWAVMREGGPFHASFRSPAFAKYLDRLRHTGRAGFAEDLERRAASGR